MQTRGNADADKGADADKDADAYRIHTKNNMSARPRPWWWNILLALLSLTIRLHTLLSVLFEPNFSSSAVSILVTFSCCPLCCIFLFHKGIQKNMAIHILFVEKRGPIIYLATLKKGAIRHAHPYYAIYRKLPPPPPHTHTHPRRAYKISVCIL